MLKNPEIRQKNIQQNTNELDESSNELKETRERNVKSKLFKYAGLAAIATILGFAGVKKYLEMIEPVTINTSAKVIKKPVIDQEASKKFWDYVASHPVSVK